MGMNISQIVEVWRGLSPHLAKCIPGQELRKHGHADEKTSDENGEDGIVDPIESHHDRGDV
jgi:hypothetical protein